MSFLIHASYFIDKFVSSRFLFSCSVSHYFLSFYKSNMNQSYSYKSKSPYNAKIPKSRLLSLTRWINSLHIWRNLTEKELPEQAKTGVLLIFLIQAVEPTIEFQNFSPKPSSKRFCIKNLDQALSAISQLAGPSVLLPRSEEIYQGNQEKMWQLLDFIFELFIMTPARKSFKSLVNWYIRILELHGVSINSIEILSSFRNGVNFMIVINCLLDDVDLEEIYFNPQSKSELTQNLAVLINVMKKFGIPVCVTIEELGNLLDQDLILLQLYYVYRALHDRIPIKKNLKFKDDIQRSIEKLPIEKSALQTEVSDFMKPKGFFSQFTPRSYGKNKLEFDCTKETESTNAVSTSDLSPSYFSSKFSADRSLSPIKIEIISDTSDSFLEYKPQKNILNIETSPVKPSPSLRVIRPPEFHHNPHQNLSNDKEKALLYLLTPRILKLHIGSCFQAFMFSIVLDSFLAEEYSFEWKNLETMETEGKIRIKDISNVSYEKRVLMIQEKSKSLQIQCLDANEVSRYVKSLIAMRDA
ncbi:unnamed protein product [Blepharisma stoltei]|uniref:Calponin-homology (CH) domain-containing protein n=1 Tax=Blepharisma stoltei TaxID=1481888 RepID=A0AAU9K476_9CILI|nr:unnamed protein product [Blepharisma stoltei]